MQRSKMSNNQKQVSFPNVLYLSGVPLKMIKVKAGRFLMGSPEDEVGRYNDEKLHWVTLTKDYWLGETAVTQGQWEAIIGDNSSWFKKGDDYPVEQVAWYQAMDFCDRLNKRFSVKLPVGYMFSLPSEAQWEFACRAGTTTALNSGKALASEMGQCDNLAEVGWYENNSSGTTHPVKHKQPNAMGFYDMHGNVWEWCSDLYDENYGCYNKDAIDPHGAHRGSFYVNRGGAWSYFAGRCRAASRSRDLPTYCSHYLGFRLALVPVQ